MLVISMKGKSLPVPQINPQNDPSQAAASSFERHEITIKLTKLILRFHIIPRTKSRDRGICLKPPSGHTQKLHNKIFHINSYTTCNSTGVATWLLKTQHHTKMLLISRTCLAPWVGHRRREGRESLVKLTYSMQQHLEICFFVRTIDLLALAALAQNCNNQSQLLYGLYKTSCSITPLGLIFHPRVSIKRPGLS